MTAEQIAKYKQHLEIARREIAQARVMLNVTMEPCPHCQIERALAYDEYREAQELSGLITKLVRFVNRRHEQHIRSAEIAKTFTPRSGKL